MTKKLMSIVSGVKSIFFRENEKFSQPAQQLFFRCKVKKTNKSNSYMPLELLVMLCS